MIEITRRHEKRSQILLTAMFICGLAAFLIPLASQYYDIQSDAGTYESLIVALAPSEEPSPPPVAVIPAVSLKPTETPDTDDLIVATTEPTVDVPEVVLFPTNTPITVTTKEPMVTESPIIPIEATPVVTERPISDPTAIPTASPTVKPTAAVAVDLDACRKINSDFVSWLRIPGTVISYPVVRSDNSDFYLNHLFDGTKSKLGCLFSLKSSDYAKPSRNIAVYGHHLSASDAMFSTLLKYKQRSYWEKHQTIVMDTLYGRRTYRIFAVVNMMVSDWDPATASFKSDAAYLKFINRARNKALIDSGISVTADDYILTLITCDRSYGGASGRLILMAVLEQ